MAITYSSGLYTLSTSGSYTPADLYAYNSAGITRHTGSRTIYDFGSSRITVGSGTTLTIDTDDTYGEIMFSDPGWDGSTFLHHIKVASGGTLNLGSATTRDALIVMKDISALSYLDSDRHIYIEGEMNWVGGGLVFLEGGSLQVYNGASGEISGTAWIYALDENVNSAVVRYSEGGFNMLACQFYFGSLVPFVLPDSGGAFEGLSFFDMPESQPTVGIDNDGITGVWMPCKGWDVSSDTLDKAFGFWDNRWARYINQASGTDFVCKGNLANDSRNKGLCEVRQEIEFSATNGGGAKFYTVDTDNGNRLAANQIANNPNYQTDRTYTLTESGGTASYTTDGGVLIGVHYRDTGGLQASDNEFDSRGINNDKTDIFNWLKVEYGKQPATLDVEMKGTSAVQSSIAQLVDLGVTETTKATVASYTGIAVAVSSGVMTITLSAERTWAQVYDYVKYWESENPAYVWANGKESFISSADGKNFTFKNCKIVIASGGDLTINPEETTLIFPTDAATPCITNNGRLELGVKTGSVYTQGVAIRCEYDPVLTYDTSNEGLLYSSANGSEFYGYGATIESAPSISFAGDNNNNYTGTIVIEDLEVRNINTTKGLQLRFDNAQGETVNVSGLTVSGQTYDVAILFSTDFTSFSANFVRGYIQEFINQLTDLTFESLNFADNLSLYDFFTNGSNVSPDDVFTFTNVDNGSDIVFYNNDVNIRGALAIKTTLTVKALSPTGVPLVGAKSYLPTYDDGNQLEPVGRTGFNWTSEPTYTFTADASGEDENDILIATAVNTGSAGSSSVQWSYRSVSADTTDDFQYITCSYGYSPATSTPILKGAEGVSSEIRLLADLGITETTKSTVSAYTGFTATGAKIILTQPHTPEACYDYQKAYESDHPNVVWANNKSSYVSSAAGIQTDQATNYVLSLQATLQNGRKITGGTIEVDGGTFECPLENVTLHHTTAGTYDYRTKQLSGTITFTADEAVTILVTPGLSFVATDPNVTVQANEAFPIVNPNIEDDTQYFVHNLTQDTYLVSGGMVSGGSGLSINRTFGTNEEIETGDEIEIVLSKYDKTTIAIQRTAGSGGIFFTDEQQDCPICAAYAIDQTTALSYGSVFVPDYPNIQIDFHQSGTFNWGVDQFFAWAKAMGATDADFQKNYNGMFAPSSSFGQIVINAAVMDLFLDNPTAGSIAVQTNTNPNLSGRPALIRSDGVSIEFPRTDGGKIILNPSIEVVVAIVNTTGSPVITGTLADVQAAITAQTSNLKGADNRDLTEVYDNGGGTGSGATPAEIWSHPTRELTAGPKDGEIDAIKVKTDQLPADPAGVSDLPADKATEIDAIKAKTDQLPADPAGVSDLPADKATEIDAIKAKTDQLPADPAGVSDLPADKATEIDAIKERTDRIPDAPMEAGEVEANVKKINDAPVVGDGSEQDKWRGENV